MMTTHRPLKGLAIGLSISESEDLANQGLKRGDINTVTVEMCRRFVALGAQVVLGHQWRPQGVMEFVARFAQAYRGEAGEGPIIHNYMAWPNRAGLSEADRKQLSSLVDIHELQDHQNDLPAALLAMRRIVADKSDARICLAGKLYQKPGFVHGVIEEVALTLELGKPVYLSRMMGGSTAVMIGIIEGDPMDARRKHLRNEGREGDWNRTQEYLTKIKDVGGPRLAEICGLTEKDLKALFNSHNLDTIIQLTSRGLMNAPSTRQRQR